MAGDGPSNASCLDPAAFEETAELPDLDRVLDALANGTRRHVLYHLLSECDATVDALADVLIGWRLGTSSVVEPNSREQLVLALYHVHIPKLVEADFVEYDDGADAVALQSVSPPVEELVAYTNGYDRAVDEPQSSHTEE